MRQIVIWTRYLKINEKKKKKENTERGKESESRYQKLLCRALFFKKKQTVCIRWTFPVLAIVKHK